MSSKRTDSSLFPVNEQGDRYLVNKGVVDGISIFSKTLGTLVLVCAIIVLLFWIGDVRINF